MSFKDFKDFSTINHIHVAASPPALMMRKETLSGGAQLRKYRPGCSFFQAFFFKAFSAFTILPSVMDYNVDPPNSSTYPSQG